MMTDLASSTATSALYSSSDIDGWTKPLPCAMPISDFNFDVRVYTLTQLIPRFRLFISSQTPQASRHTPAHHPRPLSRSVSGCSESDKERSFPPVTFSAQEIMAQGAMAADSNNRSLGDGADRHPGAPEEECLDAERRWDNEERRGKRCIDFSDKRTAETEGVSSNRDS
jgi:hypothetical protein